MSKRAWLFLTNYEGGRFSQKHQDLGNTKGVGSLFLRICGWIRRKKGNLFSTSTFSFIPRYTMVGLFLGSWLLANAATALESWLSATSLRFYCQTRRCRGSNPLLIMYKSVSTLSLFLNKRFPPLSFFSNQVYLPHHCRSLRTVYGVR